MFYKDSREIYRVTELDSLPWLVHGFGTRLARVPALFGNLATLRQIHSGTCVTAAGRGGVLGEGDALLENTPGSVVAVKTADCLPILLVDAGHGAVAAVHAGWRGTVAGIVQRAFEVEPPPSTQVVQALAPRVISVWEKIGGEVRARLAQAYE